MVARIVGSEPGQGCHDKNRRGGSKHRQADYERRRDLPASSSKQYPAPAARGEPQEGRPRAAQQQQHEDQLSEVAQADPRDFAGRADDEDQSEERDHQATEEQEREHQRKPSIRLPFLHHPPPAAPRQEQKQCHPLDHDEDEPYCRDDQPVIGDVAERGQPAHGDDEERVEDAAGQRPTHRLVAGRGGIDGGDVLFGRAPAGAGPAPATVGGQRRLPADAAPVPAAVGRDRPRLHLHDRRLGRHGARVMRGCTELFGLSGRSRSRR